MFFPCILESIIEFFYIVEVAAQVYESASLLLLGLLKDGVVRIGVFSSSYSCGVVYFVGVRPVLCLLSFGLSGLIDTIVGIGAYRFLA